MIGSASDLLRLLEAVRKGGAPVLRQSTAAEMFRNQIEGVPPAFSQVAGSVSVAHSSSIPPR